MITVQSQRVSAGHLHLRVGTAVNETMYFYLKEAGYLLNNVCVSPTMADDSTRILPRRLPKS